MTHDSVWPFAVDQKRLGNTGPHNVLQVANMKQCSAVWSRHQTDLEAMM